MASREVVVLSAVRSAIGAFVVPWLISMPVSWPVS